MRREKEGKNMDKQVAQWLGHVVTQLKNTFGDRIIMIGHVGSYARGEATASSDIDVNLILDRVDIEDLEQYRAILKQLPESDKACGFIGGLAELAAWPRRELFQFLHGCEVLAGSADQLIAPLTDREIWEDIQTIASAAYHEACHRFLYGRDIQREAEALKGAYKSACFAIQELTYLRFGRYVPTRKELLRYTEGRENQILNTYLQWEHGNSTAKERFLCLMEWSSGALQEAGGKVKIL